MRTIKDYMVVGGSSQALMQQAKGLIAKGYKPQGGITTQPLPGQVAGSIELHFFQAFILEEIAPASVLPFPGLMQDKTPEASSPSGLYKEK